MKPTVGFILPWAGADPCTHRQARNVEDNLSLSGSAAQSGSANVGRGTRGSPSRGFQPRDGVRQDDRLRKVHQVDDFADVVQWKGLAGWKYRLQAAIAIAQQLLAFEIRHAHTAIHHHVENWLDPLRVAPIEVLALGVDILQRRAGT